MTVNGNQSTIKIPFAGHLDESLIESAMSAVDLSEAQRGKRATRWRKPHDTKETYPLVVDTMPDESRGLLIIRGFVFADDGKTRLSLEGDDGVTHHAKSGASGDFDNLCDDLRRRLADATRQTEQVVTVPQDENAPKGNEEQFPMVEGMPTFDDVVMASSGSRTPSAPVAMGGYPRSQPTQPVPCQVPQMAQATQQAPLGPSPQQYPQYQQGIPPRPQYPSPQMSQQPMAMPQPQSQPQFGYGVPLQQQMRGIAPGWTLQSVPNKCWMFIAISCIELILLIAESMYANYIVSLITIALFAWPAIPAVVHSFAYKRAFQQGNAPLAMQKMKSARGWIIGAGIWCAVETLINLVLFA